MVKHFRELRVYQAAFALSITLHKASADWPDCHSYSGVTDQLRRSSKSIAANIAEGFGKQESRAEFRRYLTVSLGSLRETEMWLDYAEALAYAPAGDISAWREQLNEIGKMLVVLRQRANTQRLAA